MDSRFNQAWNDYYTYEAKAAGTQDDAGGFVSSLTRHLIESNTINATSTVLDVGCGTGRVAVALGNYCAKVHGIDKNRSCVDAAYLHSGSKPSVTFSQMSWEDVTEDCDFSYDLILACMSPFIRSGADIAKLEGLSNSTCAIVTVRPGSSNPLMMQVMRQLPIKPNEGIILQQKAIVDLLDKAGRTYTIIDFCSQSTKREPIDEFVQREILHMRALGVEEHLSRPALQSCASEFSKEGIVTIESSTLHSLIIWKAT